MKALNKKGFTMAELLIVMAIVVVLAAIAIPTFGNQLETARETADAQAIRTAVEDAFTDAYAVYASTGAFRTDDLTVSSPGVGDLQKGKDGKYEVKIIATQKKAGFDQITPRFNIGIGSTEVTLTETAGKGLGTTAAGDTVEIEFQIATGTSKLELKSVTVAAAG